MLKLEKELNKVNWDYLIKEMYQSQEEVDREEAIAELFPYVEKWIKHIIKQYPNTERRCPKCNMLFHPDLEPDGHTDCCEFTIRICI